MIRQTMLAAIAALATFPTPTVAQEEDARSCTSITHRTERLACYDGFLMDQVEVVTAEGDDGRWLVNTVTSPIDDSTNVFLFLPSREGVTDRFGREVSLRLAIACRENTTSVWFNFGGLFMSDNAGAGRITYRIDSATAQTRDFRESSDNQALGLWNGGSSIPFIQSLFGAEQLFVQATPYSESPVNDFFDIGGLEVAIEPLRESCGW